MIKISEIKELYGIETLEEMRNHEMLAKTLGRLEVI